MLHGLTAAFIEKHGVNRYGLAYLKNCAKRWEAATNLLFSILKYVGCQGVKG
ncbi:hypothetical protein T01_7429 [Trichinella spiralis]|uniref:Uncharacterized protein n=1 Tax=Trichinella spiralis TaxID=6334 RepID=A0A0V0YXE9_TRISP|nr:hypothetical protein T01_7429 [Trichinella spiralis]